MIELEYVVDCFVIIEQPHTLTGTPKPLYFKEHNTTRFARFMNKIITLTSEDKPHPDAWARAHHFRNMGLAALKDVDPDAMIIYSDVDEIVSWQHLLVLKTADDFPINAFVHFDMPLSYYNYHWNAVSGAFSNAKTFLRSYLDAYHSDNLFFDSSSPHWNLPDSGWHCSYCFSVDGILLKLRSFEHTDLNWAPFNEPSHISHHIQHGIDLFDRENHEFTWRDAPDRLPRALTEYPDRFRPLFLPGNTVAF